MAEKLKDYQVIDVFCGGTFYKVRHKVTNNIFAWKAYNCSEYSHEQIQNVVNEVKTISKVSTTSLLKYYDTILHAPTKTLYFVLEYNSWRSVQELIEVCKATDKIIEESFVWYLLLELARVCKAVEDLNIVVIQKCISSGSIYIGSSGEVRVNCFELKPTVGSLDVMRQIGDVIYSLCYRCEDKCDSVREFYYSDDLRDILSFLRDDRDTILRPDVVLYHPTVLINLEDTYKSKSLSEILVSAEHNYKLSEKNKCDSEKAVDLCRAVEPLPRSIFNIADSPVYCNINPKPKSRKFEQSSSSQAPLSPTLAALALELPGYVPRSRKPYTEPDLCKYHNYPQQISEQTLSDQWISRIVALRQREQFLNKRERELLAKEIVSSPSTKIIPLNDSSDFLTYDDESNGITLPPIITQAKDDRRELFSRRRRPRASSVRSRSRRKSMGYEDLDSSLSADAGDGSIIITATKITKENMPRRNIFPEVSTKKVHFTSSNPFVESDDSVTLTFYELDNAENEGQPTAMIKDVCTKDISKFKYLDLKQPTEKRPLKYQWNQSSPPKVAKTTKTVFSDVTNLNGMRKTPSKSSLTSQSSNSSRQSMFSAQSHWSIESNACKMSEGNIAERTRSAAKCLPQTPVAPPEIKKNKSRKSLINFKTPFKFMSATKI